MSDVLDKPADEIIDGYLRLQSENKALKAENENLKAMNAKLAENLARCLPPNSSTETLNELIL